MLSIISYDLDQETILFYTKKSSYAFHNDDLNKENILFSICYFQQRVKLSIFLSTPSTPFVFLKGILCAIWHRFRRSPPIRFVPNVSNFYPHFFSTLCRWVNLRSKGLLIMCFVNSLSFILRTCMYHVLLHQPYSTF